MQLTIQQRSVNFDKNLQSYSCELEVTGSADITKKCLVMQRIVLPNQTKTDTFVAVATPVQLEDFPDDLPGPDSSYYLTDMITVRANSSTYLSEVIDTIITELGQLVDNMVKLQALTQITTYTITTTSV